MTEEWTVAGEAIFLFGDQLPCTASCGTAVHVVTCLFVFTTQKTDLCSGSHESEEAAKAPPVCLRAFADCSASRHVRLGTGNRAIFFLSLLLFFREVKGSWRAAHQGLAGRTVALETVCFSFSVNTALFLCGGCAAARLYDSDNFFSASFFFLNFVF